MWARVLVFILALGFGQLDDWFSGFLDGFDAPDCTSDGDCQHEDALGKFGEGAVCESEKCSFMRTCTNFECLDDMQTPAGKNPASLWCLEDCDTTTCCEATTTTTSTAPNGTEPGTGVGTEDSTTLLITTTTTAPTFSIEVQLTITGTPGAGSMDDWSASSKDAIEAFVAEFAELPDDSEVVVELVPGQLANTTVINVTLTTVFISDLLYAKEKFEGSGAGTVLRALLMMELLARSIPVPANLNITAVVSDVKGDSSPAGNDDDDGLGAGAITAICLASIAALGGAVMIARECKKRKKCRPPSSQDTTESPNDAADSFNDATALNRAPTAASAATTVARPEIIDRYTPRDWRRPGESVEES